MAPRILIYTHAFAPKVGGVETIVMSLANGLARLDRASQVEVTLATATPRGDFNDGSLPFRVVRRPGLLELVRLIRTADVVHIAGPAFSPLLLGLLIRKPVVVEHHGFQTICPNGQLLHEPSQTFCPGHFMAGRHRECLRCNVQVGLLGSVKLWFLTFPRRWLCGRVGANVTPTTWLAGLLGLPRMTTIYHGLAVDSNSKSRLASSPIGVAFIGRLVATKGVDVLLRAMSRLKTKVPFTLKIIGDGPERSRLEAQAQDLGLAHWVQFFGYQSDAELSETLSGVRAIVMPSLAGEVFGMVAAENMMRGIMPIVSAGGALAEVVGDAGLTFPAGDDEALAACLVRILDEPGLPEVLGERARRRAQQLFSEERMVAQHLSTYFDLVSDQTASGAPADSAKAECRF